MLLHEELRKFVIDNFMFGKPCEGFADDDSFIERGIIDSTAVMELIAYLEARFRIKLQDRDLIPENFDSINKLARFVESRLHPNGKLQVMLGTDVFAEPLTAEQKR
jgi:acyl carrier protein